MRVLFIAIILAILNITPAAAQSIATFNKISGSVGDFDFNEVYGSISFQLGTPFKLDQGVRKNYQYADRAAFEALRSLAGKLNNLFGRSTGSYIVTLSVTNAITGKDVIKAPVLSISSDVQKTLFFEKSRDDLFSLTQEQTLRDYIPVTGDNNKFKVTLEASNVESTSLDLGILRNLVAFQAQIAGLSAAPIATSADAVIKGFEGILKTIFDSNKKIISQSTIEMSFIKRDAHENASVTEIVIKTNPTVDGNIYNVNLPILINFRIQPTRLSARIGQNGTFDGLIPTSIVELTSLIPASPTAGSLFDALRSSKESKVRSFLDEIVEKQKVQGGNAATGCRRLYNALPHHLTQRDQAAYYYAFVRLYQVELKASDNGEGCLQEPMRSELNRWLRLPEGGLDIVSKDQPAVRVVAVGKNGRVIDTSSMERAAEFVLEGQPQSSSVPPGLTPDVEPGTLPLFAVQ